MKKGFKTSIVLIAGLALALAGCSKNDQPTGTASSSAEPSGSASAAEAAKLKVVTTFYPMYEFSKQVGGEYADVVALVPPGTEPHDWEPSPQDMVKVKEADIFVYNGLVEEWVEDALASAASDKRIIVKASEGIELMEGLPHEHGHEDEHADEHADEDEHAGEDEHADEHADEHGDEHADEHEHVLDPHVWLDPVLAQQQVAAIADAFAKADPDRKDDYKKNADAYIAKLQELDEAFKTELGGAKRKEFVTQHAAFGYLAKRYGLTQLPISGLSPDQEPSPNEMAEIVEFAKEHQVKTIFFETLVDPKVAQTVADELGARTDVLNPLEGLTEEEVGNNQDYIAIMRSNLEALKKALNE